jgi:cobalt-zinc-cadmium efflux system membrane fusion protein
MNKYIFVFFCLLLVAGGCRVVARHVFTLVLTIEGETITVRENSPILEQIVIGKALLQDFSAEFRTVGTVRPVAGKLAEIAPPFAGRVVQSFVRLG